MQQLIPSFLQQADTANIKSKELTVLRRNLMKDHVKQGLSTMSKQQIKTYLTK